MLWNLEFRCNVRDPANPKHGVGKEAVGRYAEPFYIGLQGAVHGDLRHREVFGNIVNDRLHSHRHGVRKAAPVSGSGQFLVEIVDLAIALFVRIVDAGRLDAASAATPGEAGDQCDDNQRTRRRSFDIA